MGRKRATIESMYTKTTMTYKSYNYHNIFSILHINSRLIFSWFMRYNAI